MSATARLVCCGRGVSPGPGDLGPIVADVGGGLGGPAGQGAGGHRIARHRVVGAGGIGAWRQVGVEKLGRLLTALCLGLIERGRVGRTQKRLRLHVAGTAQPLSLGVLRIDGVLVILQCLHLLGPHVRRGLVAGLDGFLACCGLLRGLLQAGVEALGEPLVRRLIGVRLAAESLPPAVSGPGHP